MRERFVQLDALRGLAAFTVLLCHLALIPSQVSPVIYDMIYRASSPLGIIVRGHQAVIFFFILSGFVLALPILHNQFHSYRGYLIKRFFRIYLPYLAALLIGLGLLAVSPKIQYTAISGILNETWTHNLTNTEFLQHLAGIGMFNTTPLNGVIWTLVHEMRISLIFPLVVMALMHFRWYYAVIAGLLLSCATAVNTVIRSYDPKEMDGSYFSSLHYLSFFIAGMLLAKYHKNLITGFNRLNLYVKTGAVVSAYVLYNYTDYSVRVLDMAGIRVRFEAIFSDYVASAGIVIFIVAALSSRRATAVLSSKIPVFLGNVSYSLYLFHLLIILFLIRQFFEKLPLTLIVLISGVLSILAAYAGYVLIEKPTMAWGRRLAARMKPRRKQPETVGPLYSGGRT
jgi:peptidoglycan/LPS O-acetylase OafA/YrhL